MKRLMGWFVVLAMLLVAGVASPALAQEEESEGGGEASIADIASQAGNFTVLLGALEAAGLAEMFADCAGGPYTVFAPTDEAIASTVEGVGLSVEQATGLLLDPANSELLTSVLTYHVVDGAVLSSDLSDGQEVATLQGESLTIGVGDAVTVNDATVTAADNEACNGVVHVIDGLLIPASILPDLAAAAAAVANGDEEAAEDTEAAAEEEAEAEAEEETEAAAEEETEAAAEEEAELAETGNETLPVLVFGVTIALAGLMFLAAGRRLRHS